MSPFPTIVPSLLCVIAFLPGESAIKLLISSSNPETILLVEAASVMMASINPNKASDKSALRFIYSFGIRDALFCQCFHIQHRFGSISQSQVTGIRGQQDNENMSLETSLTCQAGGTVIYYIIIQCSREMRCDTDR